MLVHSIHILSQVLSCLPLVFACKCGYTMSSGQGEKGTILGLDYGLKNKKGEMRLSHFLLTGKQMLCLKGQKPSGKHFFKKSQKTTELKYHGIGLSALNSLPLDFVTYIKRKIQLWFKPLWVEYSDISKQKMQLPKLRTSRILHSFEVYKIDLNDLNISSVMGVPKKAIYTERSRGLHCTCKKDGPWYAHF